MSAEGTTRKRMGITAIISSIFIVASLVWGIYSFVLIQSGNVRPYDPHFEYDTIEYWPYTHDFAGKDSNWFDNLNYTDLQLNDTLPDDLLDRMNDPVFYVAPADPGQLWRIESYDQYDGSSWSKTLTNTRFLIPGEELIPLSATNNTVYTILFNATAGAEVGTISLPTLFPLIRVIEDSFETYTLVDDLYVPDVPTRLLYYDLETDDYGTLLFSPLIDGITGTDVLVSFQVTFVDQDINQVQALAQLGAFAPPSTDIYRDLSLVLPLTQRVTDNISQFVGVGSNAFETVMAVQAYFQSTFTLNITVEALLDRPGTREVTDWFLERGNGLPQDFATAYCVFMRDLGIPARVVTGYALGEPHPTADMRTLMVRHMAFWAEVFIPMAGHPDGLAGEWIQVIPAPLPDDMGGGEDPGNTPVSDVVLTVWPTNLLIYADIGTPFDLSAIITVDGVLLTTPELVTFYDVTDTELIGTAVIGDSFPGIANITYTFPSNSTVDFHYITATWSNPYFQVYNATQVYAVSTPVPMADEASSLESPDVVLAETHELDINLGLDTHVAYWNDTVHVYGIMTAQGSPVNSSKYDNRYIQIMWDATIVGDAFIDEYGYYEYDIYVDPLDLALMKVGPHEVWSSYAGDMHPTLGFWRLYPARSADNSTVTVWGRVDFDFSVNPLSVSTGGTLTYDGTIRFLNGSLLPSGQNVSTFFGTQANSSRVLNATGGFQWSYVIPGAQSEGFYIARANWTSPWQYIAGNWSISIDIEVGSEGSQIIMNPLPDPIFIGDTYTISGYLQYAGNSSGIGSQTIQVYWDNGSLINIGSNITAADGYFEVSYLVPAGYIGPVTYWANFSSPIPELANSESTHLGTNVKQYDVDITIADSPDPINLLQTVTIQGTATLPENSSSPLSVELLEVYWANSTYPNGVLIGTTWTNALGVYAFYYQIPLSHGIETVSVWVNFTSPYTNIADGASLPESLTIELTGTLITVNSDFASYYLNETVQITGHLQFSNGTPIPFERVFIHWYNASGPLPWIFEKFTDINGDYQFQYNLSTSMATGFVDVHVNWTDTYGLYTDAFADLAPPIQLNRYDLEIVTNIPSQVFVDEIIVVQGNLTYAGGAPPLVGELVELAWWNTTNQWEILGYLPTNITGTFYAELAIPQFELTYNFRLQYFATDPINNDVLDYYFDVDAVKYAINLDVTALPNPVMQNETLTIHAHLYYAHNGTAIQFTDVNIYWDYGNGTLLLIGNITTDGTGHGDLFYSGMDYDTIRTGIHVYGFYVGSALHASIESVHTILTLQQWQSDLVGLNTPVGIYYLLDTVVVTGTLWYVSPSVSYGGAYVELLLLGVPVDNATTASDGSFSLSWTIPSDTPVGFYDLEVRFTAPYPWILGVQEFVPTIQIIAPTPIFTVFTVSPESPAPVIVLDNLNITGIVTWDNGSLYNFSLVSLYWGNPFGAYFWMADVMTNGAGAFAILYQVPEGTALGIREVWAYIPPAGIATFGMSSTRSIDIQVHSLVITANVDVTTAYLGETITIFGFAHFSNGTPLTGYSIEIWWDSILISTEIADATGNYSYAHLIPYTDAVGNNSGYVFFNAPTGAFPDVTTNFADVQVREYIDIYLDTQPPSNIFSRGDTITITGYVENEGGFGTVSVDIRVLGIVSSSGYTTSTDGAGIFSFDLVVDNTVLGGQYIITIESIDPDRDVLSVSGSWTVIVVVDSTVSVRVDSASYMPGETFTIQLELFDEDGAPINGVSIDISFNSTYISSVTLVSGSRSFVTVTIPASWSSSGYYEITVDYVGSTYLNGDSSVSAESIHIFTRPVFTNGSPTTVTPGQDFIIEVYVTDPEQNIIVNRPVLLDLNGAQEVPLTIDSDGIIQYNIPGQNAGTFNFLITLTSNDVPSVSSDTYGISIQTTGGIILQGMDLVIAGVLLVGAIIAVLAYLYIVKGMFRSVVISRGIDIPTKLRNIKKLADAGKYGASITLAYRTFEQMCGSKMGSERTHSETAREYLDRVLQSIPLDQSSVEQFVQTYEEARFSHHEMTRERYEAALRVFTDIYPRIDTSSLME